MAERIPLSTEEYAIVDQAYQALRTKMQDSLTEEDRVLMDTAYRLAVDSHGAQRRKSGEPYILHPIEVARICYDEIGLGPTAITAAILHDVVEDTPVTQEEINETFGIKIGKIVDGLTKLDGMYNTESPQAANYKKVLSTLVEDVRVSLIKMADRLHNLRTIDSMPIHKKLKIAAETSYIYTPLAHRLGLYNFKTEYQDICMRISEPEAYEDIQNKLESSEKGRQDYIDSFINPLKAGLDELSIPYRIFGRAKSIYSIMNKIKKKHVAFEEIYDLFAVRIVVDVPVEKEKSICWQVYSIITDFFKPIPERLKDWVTNPKSNGYESLHTTVIGPKGRFVEIQIRSERMDAIAERGFAAHWKYKGASNDNDNIYQNWLDNIRELLETQHTDALEFVNDFKTNLFNEEVYVFTPNGDMRILPKGATALDFAFDIHSDVGYHAIAIKVNNKLVPMGQELDNGDRITVTTSQNQKPNEEWLKNVITGKAKSKIRSSLKEDKKLQAELGKESLSRKLKKLKVSLEDNIEFLVNHYKFKNRTDFYYAFANDRIKLSDIKKFDIINGKFAIPEEPKENTELIPKIKPLSRKSKANILVNGEPIDQYRYEMAVCCKPLPGDNIFAYLTSLNNIKIHRFNCSNSTNILANYGYRVLKAEWQSDIMSEYIVTLQLRGIDTGIGVIQKITTEISINLDIDIRNFSIDSSEGYFECNVSVVVKNKEQLTVAIRSLKNLDGISSVERIDKDQ